VDAEEGELAVAVGYQQYYFECRPVGASEKVCVLLFKYDLDKLHGGFSF
jgi:hypothetical protein